MTSKNTLHWLVRLVIAAALVSNAALAQLPLKSGTIVFSADTTSDFLKALETAPAEALHGLAAFPRRPTKEEQDILERLGLHLLSSLNITTYRVRVEKRFAGFKTAFPHRLLLRRLEAVDRIEPALWQGAFSRYVVKLPGEKMVPYVVDAGGNCLNVTLRMNPDTSTAERDRLLRRYAGRQFQLLSDHVILACVRRDVVKQRARKGGGKASFGNPLRMLADEDAVQWIDAGPPPFLPENNSTRQVLNVDAVQQFVGSAVTGVGGRDVRVGVFDKGIDESHQDLKGVVRNDAPMHAHATHIAGIIIASGLMSDKKDSHNKQNGSVAYKWRGMAPLAQVIDIDQGGKNGPNGASAAIHKHYIDQDQMDLSNHSYTFNLDGSYSSTNQIRDEIIRGDARVDGNPVPNRLMVTSAGNRPKYFTLSKQLKNALVVGAWNSSANQMFNGSSGGPTSDGRIKPDVIAPGAGVKSTGFCVMGEKGEEVPCKQAIPPPWRRDYYRPKTGTSMASAAASGVIALVLEQYRTAFGSESGRNPLPSTLRAVVIQTARDKPPGASPPPALRPPDFKMGWGIMDAKAAVELVAATPARLLEETLVNSCEVIKYSFDVPEGTTDPIRVTLAWDDAAGDPALALGYPQLVNDIDLVLIDKNGGRHLPWQINQKFVGAAGQPPTCGELVIVTQTFVPNPGNTNPTPPVAVPGEDHLNNVEVVDATAISGRWEAHVIGFNIPQGPQRFSLVGQAFTRLSSDVQAGQVKNLPAPHRAER